MTMYILYQEYVVTSSVTNHYVYTVFTKPQIMLHQVWEKMT